MVKKPRKTQSLNRGLELNEARKTRKNSKELGQKPCEIHRDPIGNSHTKPSGKIWKNYKEKHDAKIEGSS